MDSIQGRVLLGILMELKEEYTPRVAFQAVGVADCILGNANQGRICAMDVVRWDTSFGIATRPKGMVLVHLEGNDGRTKVKRNH
jgi:hypothetical protein